MRPGPERDHRNALIEVLATAHGFTPPLRVGIIESIAQIYEREITALLAAGWEPTGFREQRDALAEELKVEQRRWVELRLLVLEWRDHGFGTQSGAKYAEQLDAVLQ